MMKRTFKSAPEQAAQDSKDLTSAPSDKGIEIYLTNPLIN